LIKSKRLLGALVLGLALGAAAEAAISAKLDIGLRASSVEYRVDPQPRGGLMRVESNDNRYSKKVFKRFWARTAYV